MHNISQPSFSIGIPTINRFDLLCTALPRYFNDFPNQQIYVLDNGKQGIKDKIQHRNLTVIESDRNLGVAGSWNYLAKLAFCNHSHILMLNDDVYLGKQADIINSLLGREYDNSFFVSQRDWSVFLLFKDVYNKVGRFDENFKTCYFEDVDFERRLKLAGVRILESQLLNAIEYANSSSIAKDSSLNAYFNENRDYYIRKWGGGRGGERFNVPFGIST